MSIEHRDRNGRNTYIQGTAPQSNMANYFQGHVPCMAHFLSAVSPPQPPLFLLILYFPILQSPHKHTSTSCPTPPHAQIFLSRRYPETSPHCLLPFLHISTTPPFHIPFALIIALAILFSRNLLSQYEYALTPSNPRCSTAYYPPRHFATPALHSRSVSTVSAVPGLQLYSTPRYSIEALVHFVAEVEAQKISSSRALGE